MIPKRIFCPALLLFSLGGFSLIARNPLQDGFKADQLRYERVRDADAEKTPVLEALFEEKGLVWPPGEILLRAFKQERTLELWARPSTGEDFILVRAYDICALSGGFGPKRREGDLQIPEGFYRIDRFNPASAFHLSLGLNYPNGSDKLLSDRDAPGGDIFIHGACVTIGCLPLTDDKIKEVYLAAVEAREAGQALIPVQIFPCRMDDAGMCRLGDVLAGAPPPDSLPLKDSPGDEDLLSFWRNLKEGYDRFERSKRPPSFSIESPTGRYLFHDRASSALTSPGD